MATIVHIEQLCVRYGSKIALQDANLKIEEGDCVGLLGRNGSGKTTLMKVLAGLLHPQSGTVRICGEPIGNKTKALVSYLPDRNTVPSWMSVADIRAYYRDFFSDFRDKVFEDMLDRFELPKDIKVRKMSKGMQEKLSIALTFSREASLYILDEPIGGVDPIARDVILDAIIDKAYEKHTILLSTQLVRDIERIFDRVAFLSEGRVALEGETEVLREEYGFSVEEIFKTIYGRDANA